jgi:hypothetical protein
MGTALRSTIDLPETISIFFVSTVSSMKTFCAVELAENVLAGNMNMKKSNRA